MFNVADKTGDTVDINIVRQVTRQPHDNGDIGVVTFAGQRQRTVDVHHHASGIHQLLAGNQFIDKQLAGFHRADGVGAGWANTNFENIENADHGLASFFRC
ncbi:hypothetical protein D3C78_1608330 [compost metagenome]